MMMAMNSVLVTLLLLVDVALWYAFLYYLLYYIKHDVDLRRAAGVLLVLLSLALMTCPIVISSFVGTWHSIRIS